MRNYYYLMAAFMFLIHFWRFPHLVMENGGGAFVITYLILLVTISLPLFIAEVAYGKIFSTPGTDQYAIFREKARGHLGLTGLAILQIIFQNILLVGLFQYLIFVGCLAFIKFQEIVLHVNPSTMEPGLGQPGLMNRFVVLAGFLVLVAGLSVKKFTRAIDVAVTWIIPICLLVFIVVFGQMLSVGHQIEGIKTLLYPDFSLLGPISLMEALGHALISIGAGVGFQRLSAPILRKYDPVDVAVQIAFISALIALFSGLLALPMVEQISETAFGANWMFFILPRWLLYNQHGQYYCALFFLSLLVLSVFLAVLVCRIFGMQMRKSKPFTRPVVFLSGNSLIAVFLIVLFYQKNWWGWWGQGVFLLLDRFFIDLLLPINGLILIGILFLLSSRHQRQEVFAHQQVFFHSDYFYMIWRLSCRILFPLVFVFSLLLALLAR